MCDTIRSEPRGAADPALIVHESSQRVVQREGAGQTRWVCRRLRCTSQAAAALRIGARYAAAAAAAAAVLRRGWLARMDGVQHTYSVRLTKQRRWPIGRESTARAVINRSIRMSYGASLPPGAVEAAACSPFAAAERARPPVKFFLVTDDPSMRVTAAAALGADSLINIQEIPERPRSCCDVMLRLRCLCSFRVAAWPSSF